MKKLLLFLLLPTFLSGLEFSPRLVYLNDPLFNPIGGKTQRFGQIGELKFLLDVDLKNDWVFHTSWIWKSGKDLSAYIENAFNVAELYGGRTYRLATLSLKKGFCNNKGIFKIGRIGAGDNFMYSPLYDYFINTAFNPNPIAVYFNFPAFSAFPIQTWGIFLQTPFGNQFKILIGAYNASSRIFKNGFHGWNFSFYKSEGVELLSQITYETKSAHHYAGVLYQTGKFPLYSGGNGQGNFCTYFHLQQKIHPNITPFATLFLSLKDRSEFPYFAMGGIVFENLIRKQDPTSFGIAYGSYSSDLRKQQRREKDPTQNFEAVVELNHRFNLPRKTYISPVIQYVINPKGLRSTPNAIVLGMEIKIEL